MGLLDQILAFDAANVFCDSDGLAESVTHQAYPSGTQTVLSAVVFRLEPQMENGIERVPVGQLEVQIAVASLPTVNRGSDKILVSDRQGGPATWHVVNDIVSQDAGMWRLRLK